MPRDQNENKNENKNENENENENEERAVDPSAFASPKEPCGWDDGLALRL